jgi:hypothetical protein
MIYAIRTLPEIDTRLFLSREAFSKEVSLPGLLNGIVGFNVHQFSNALSNAVAVGNGVKIGARILALRHEPFAGAWCVLVFEPTVRVGDRYTMQDFGHRLNDGVWRSRG